MESGSVLFGVLEGSDNVGLTSEFFLLDTCPSALCEKIRDVELTLINLDDILPYNSTSTNVQVTTVSTTSPLQKK